MQIEVGKKYWTRDKSGWRLVVAKNPITGGWIVVNKHGSPADRYADGRYYDHRDDPSDLTEELREPRTATTAVDVIKCCGDPCIVLDRLHPQDRVIAHCELRWTEGKGFEIVEATNGNE